MPSVRIAKGLNLSYREAGSGDRVLLLIHGNVASSAWWERAIALLPAGVKVYAPDLRSCGDSDRFEGDWTIQDLADDIAQFAAAVGIASATVVGHSLGGSIAQQLAVAHPALVERLFLINSAPPSGLQLPEAQYAQIKGMAQQPELVKMILGAMAPTAPRDEFWEFIATESVTKSLDAWLPNGYALFHKNLVNQVAEIRVPVLILYGEKDMLVTRAMAEQTQQQIPGSVLETWPDVGHSAPVEAPERFVQRLLAWMAH